jgi:photosystem II stability/assembly factor-like uncharacterized protein
MKIFFIATIIFFNSLIYSQTEWEYLGFAGSNISDIEIDGNGNIYAALGVVYKSSDNGITWELKNNNLPVEGGSKLAHYNNQIYFATYNGLYKTTDGGEIWFRIAQSVPTVYFDEVNIISNGYIFTCVFDLGTGGVYRSTDEGITWQLTSFTGFGARDIGINTNGVMFFSITMLGGFGTYRSFDLGANWANSTPSIGAQAMEYLNDGSVLAGGEPGPTGPGIYKTTDNGNSWFNTNTFSDLNFFTDFVLDTNDDIYVSIQGDNQGVYLSTDGGGSWEYEGLSNVEVNCIAIDSSGYVYAGTYNSGVFKTPGRTTPVELISFNADVNEKDIDLSWITATETNNSGFEIERKINNDNWESIGFVEGQGTTTESQHYTFVDNDVNPGKYQYRLKLIDYDGTFEYSDIIEVEIPSVNKFSLEQNYPNPFNPATVISYQLAVTSNVVLKIYDELGNEVATLVNEEKPAGSYVVDFSVGQDSSPDIASGIYFYRLQAGSFIETKKMILLK